MLSCEPDQLQEFVCPGVVVDVVGGRGHVAVAFVDQRDFRPRFLPRFLSYDFFMVEYLAFVTFQSSDGRRMRGLYLIRSETPSSFACIASRVFSHYNFRKIDLNITETETTKRFTSTKAGIDVSIKLDDQQSDGHSWENYYELSKPRSFNFQHLARSGATLVIRGVLKGWAPQPAKVVRCHMDTVTSLGIRFDSPPHAIHVSEVDYLWRNSRIDR